MDKFAEVKGKRTDSLSNSKYISCHACSRHITKHDKKGNWRSFQNKLFLCLLPEVAEIICPVVLALD